MIKKAPKDMTAPEYEAHIESVLNTLDKFVTKNDPDRELVKAFIQLMRDELAKPAPNPFTVDQIGAMRECQRCGYGFAAMNYDRWVELHEERPERRNGKWESSGDYFFVPVTSFWNKVISPDDPEPLCFADYAPLEGESK